MQSVQTEYKLASLILSIAEAQRSIETARCILCDHTDFEPYSAFQKLDRLNRGYITVDDLNHFLRNNSVPCTFRDVHTLLKQYDTNKNGKLSYTEFMNAVLPSTNLILRNLVTQRKSIPTYLFPKDAEISLARLFQREIESNSSLELARQDLVNKYDFNLLDVFRMVDVNHSGYITTQELVSFLRRNGYLPYDEDIRDILKRFDKDGDQMISYMEFVENILPTEQTGKSFAYEVPSYSSPKHGSDYYDFKYRYPYYYQSITWDPYWKRSLQDYNFRRSLQFKQKIREEEQSLRMSFNKSPRRTYSPLRQSYTADVLRQSRFDRSFSPSRQSYYESPFKKSITNLRIYDSPRKYESTSQSKLISNLGRTSISSYRSISPTRRSSYFSEEEMVKIFQQQIKLDRELELLKQDLSLRADFNLMDAFKYFDIATKNYLTDRDIERVMVQFGIYPTMDELDLFLRRYDLDNDTRLRYSDFCDVFTSKQSEYAKLMSNRASLNTSQIVKEQGRFIFSLETQTIITKILRLHLEIELSCEKTRQRLKKNISFNSHEAFLALDRNGNGYISLDELRQVLQDHGIFPTERELIGLISRYDKNKDGRVSYSEFTQEITPLSTSFLI